MTKKVATGIAIAKPDTSIEQPQKNVQPLVFISHDTKDADLAEEFSNLLRNSSAGALKSFRSSDKKGTQGIEYGLEWYPAIMDKIDEASDVVCLLTQNSVDRPWILYEAGVAKGKLNMKVIGIALGIPLTEAVKGPFAQFQNNDGDVDSITKLVYDLVKKVPGLDPDKEVVKSLVQTFLERVSELITKKAEVKTAKESKADDDDNSVVKLFEEVKIMFQDLPHKIERRYDRDDRIIRRHPKYLLQLLNSNEDPENGMATFIIIIGYLKNDMPWIYEVGMDLYRAMNGSRPEGDIMRALDTFSNLCRLTMNHPIMREMFSREKEELYYVMKELEYYLMKQVDMVKYVRGRSASKGKLINKNDLNT